MNICSVIFWLSLHIYIFYMTIVVVSLTKISPITYGIETEYSVMLRYPYEVVHEIVGQCHSIDAKLGLYLQPDKSGSNLLDTNDIADGLMDISIVQTQSGMLSNGGRFYMDPSGPEYATPETTTAEEAVHRTFEGDFILKSVLDYLRRVESIDGYQINRRIVDHNRSSRGVHLNTTTNLSHDEAKEHIPHMATYNVVKGALFGSGGLLLDDDGSTEFHYSPRLSLTNAESANASQYEHRPLVRFPFKTDGARLGRVETVTSDALNFGWPLRASLVMTNALIKLMELKQADTLFILKNPVMSARQVGKNGDAKTVEAMDKYNKRYTVFPTDILKATCELILMIDDTEGHLDDETRQVLPEIIETADMMKKDEAYVATRVESIARKRAIERKMEKEKVDIDSEKICSYDYYWDWYGGGLAQQLRENKLVGWHGFDSTRSVRPKAKQVATPPRDTRAKIRGEQILNYGPDNESNWDMIEFDDHSHYVAPYTHDFVCIPENEYPLNQK